MMDEAAKTAWNQAISRGHAARTKGDFDAALEGYSAALEFVADDIDIIFFRGLTHFDAKNYQRAVADFTEVIRLAPKWPSGFIKRGHVHLAMNDVDSAIADYTESIKLSPTLAPLYSNRADAHLAKGDLARANADLRKAAELDRKHGS